MPTSSRFLFVQSLCATAAFALAFSSLPVQAQLPAAPAVPPAPLEQMTMTVNFSLPEGSDVPDNSFTPLWSGGGKTFLIWRTDKLHPMVTECPDGGSEPTSVLLDPDPKYFAQYRDMHHSYSMGIDKKGYIHITGDMHGYPGSNDRFMPRQYRNKQILYWKSNSPYTVKDGFTFVGGDPDKAIPGTRWSWGAFYADNNGELYYCSRVAAITKHRPEEYGIGLYRYDADKGSWTALGAEPPHVYPDGEYHPVLFWDGATAPGLSSENHGTIRFDSQNRIHFATSASTIPGLPGLNALLYASSADEGKTWTKANGTPIKGLPLTATTGPNQADLISAYNQAGLTMESFTKPNLTGTPASVKVVPAFALDSSSAAVRFSGEFVARDAGPCTIELEAGGGEATLNIIKFGKGMSDVSGQMKNGGSVTIDVEQWQTIGFILEWKRGGGGTPAARLLWTTKDHNKEPIPTAFLLPTHTRFDLFAGVFADKSGAPAVAYNPSNSLASCWRYWNAATKAWSPELPFPGSFGYCNEVYTGPDGMLTFENNTGHTWYSVKDFVWITDNTTLFRTTAFNVPPQRYVLKGFPSVNCVDQYAFRKTGVYHALGLNTTGKDPVDSVITVRFDGKK